MSRYYQLATFLQRASNTLIQEYLTSRDIPNDLVWKDRKARDVDDIYELVTGLEDERRVEIEKEFEDINELACPSAMKSVYQSCNVLNQTAIIEKLDQMSGPYEMAMWLYLNHRVQFDLAMKFDIARRDNWKYCGVGVGHELKFDEKNLDNFKDSIKNFYKLQGDARYCKVEHYEYDGTHFFFAYPEGKAEIIPQYGDSEDDIRQDTIKRLHEVVFVYSSESGVLKTNAKGSKNEVASLQEKFCQNILGMDSLPEKNNVHFNLEILKGDGFDFPLDDDEIEVEGVKLKEVRFIINPDTKNRVLVTLHGKDHHQSYANVLRSAAMGKNQKLLKAEIDYAKIQFIMKKPEKGKRPNLTFDITCPSNCTLEEGSTDKIARKYLQKWGILKILEFGEDNVELAETEELVEAEELVGIL